MSDPQESSPENDADERVPDDAGTDADVDPGLVVPSTDAPPTSDADERSSTNRTGLTPDSIQVD